MSSSKLIHSRPDSVLQLVNLGMTTLNNTVSFILTISFHSSYLLQDKVHHLHMFLKI